VLERLPALCGLTAPSFNSYRRFVPHYWAGAFTCWGHDNREAPVRVPSVFSGMEEASTNAELKAADSSCNPYLALGGLIAAGLDGVERGLELPPPAACAGALRLRGLRPPPVARRSEPPQPLIERFHETPFVLLHCYPFVREAGWLAHVYGNVWFDLSLTIPHVSRPAEQVRQALELAPVSKLLYASDAARTPELYFLAAKWWREALADVLAEELPPEEAEQAGRAILRENALALYGLA
jgi:hypothetical protein